MTRVGACVVMGIVIAAIVGPLVSPYDPAWQDLAWRLQGPTLAHPMGFDELGRDVLGRMLLGARTSLVVASIVVFASCGIGVTVGALAGYVGGVADDLLSRVMDVVMAFPGILLAIALVAVLGPGLFNATLALVAVGWVGYARLVRGLAMRARNSEYITAARAAGARLPHVMLRHLAPNVASAVVAYATLGMASTMLAEASLSFLGLGVQPPLPSWGTMLDAGRAHLLDAPHLTVFPGVSLAALVMGFNALGEGLREAADPRARLGEPTPFAPPPGDQVAEPRRRGL